MSTAHYNLIAPAFKTVQYLPLRQHVETPSLFSLLDECAGLSILDLGCGKGNYTRQLKAAGAECVVGIDSSRRKVAAAVSQEQRQPLGCLYLQMNPAKLPALKSYDRVVSMYTLCQARTKQELFSICRAAFQQLKNGGELVGMNENPFHSTSEFLRYRKYGFTKHAAPQLKEGDRITYTFHQPDGSKQQKEYYYWSPNTYRHAFAQAGFAEFQWIEAEVHPTQANNPHWEQFLAHPPVIGFRATKAGK